MESPACAGTRPVRLFRRQNEEEPIDPEARSPETGLKAKGIAERHGGDFDGWEAAI